jgi:putative transposase
MKILEPENPQFITFTTFQREHYFTNVLLRNLFLEALEEIRAKYSYEIWAYVVMKDHIHMVVFPQQTLPIEKFLYSVKKTSGFRCNKFISDQIKTALPAQATSEHNRYWQRDGSYCRSLYNKKALWAIINYIHNNPVKARYVEAAQDWQWSSAAYWIEQRKGIVTVSIPSII